MTEQPKVIIRCLVYNHEPYLRDCLEGFVMQKTNFPFKAVVHDDCSTDGSAAIIREYAEKYPHIIEPIYETENQYSKRDGSLRRVMDAVTLGRSPYIAYCEGDDYWIDPLKLQKQVDYMDAHQECSMSCSNAEVLCPNGEYLSDDYKLQRGWFICDKDMNLGLDYILDSCAHTCTLLIRSYVIKDYPDECSKCYNGDYIIQILAAVKGVIHSFKDKTAVYRYQSNGSFTQKRASISDLEKSDAWIKLIYVLNYLNKYTQYVYEKYLNRAIYKYICIILNSNLTLCDSICSKYGYVLLNQESIGSKQKLTLLKKIKYYLLKIRWYPFPIGGFILILKKMSILKRLKITNICRKHYTKYMLEKSTR